MATGNPHWNDLAQAWTAVAEFTAAIAVYGAGGWFADRWLHTGHVLFLVGLLLGMVLGVYVLIKRGDQAADAAKAARQRDRAPH